ncbi:2557_t:CDS:10 [Paraglomus occultum]|uniref:Transcription elongation factor SPT6 n=1 Tax=Paraglomus occultum TaxID=144539 RepID=A0A9N8VZ69_9GLOM|nr:2557_t:CDS:10 [Paraglomus occultum]
MVEDEDIINEDGELIQNEAMEEEEIEEESEEESTDEEEAAKVDLRYFVKYAMPINFSLNLKRKREKRIESDDDDLDDEDLELVEENTGMTMNRSERKLKRLKKRGRDEPARRHDQMRDGIPLDETGEPLSAEDLEAKSTWHELFDYKADYLWALQEARREPITRDIKDMISPNELKIRMMTDEDELIRKIDIPERMQLREGIDGKRKLTPDEIEEETSWVSKFFAEKKGTEPAKVQDTVGYIVKDLSQELVEIPYIIAQRRDHLLPHSRDRELTTEDLWTIYDLDTKFHALIEARERLRQYISKLAKPDEYVEEMIPQAERIEELNNLREYLSLKYCNQIVRPDKRGPRKADKFKYYERCRSRGVQGFVKHFGIDMRAFAKSFLYRNKMHFPNDVSKYPEQAAEEYIAMASADDNGPRLGRTTAAQLMEDAKFMLASELAYDPQIKKAFRQLYQQNGEVIVSPTDKGLNEIVSKKHPCWPFKFLKKPVSAFANSGQFLQILNSEKDGLTNVVICLRNKQNLVEEMYQYMKSDSTSQYGVQWDSHRCNIIDKAVSDWLEKDMDKWLRAKLKADAEDYVLSACRSKFEKKINIGPYGGHNLEPDMLPRVIALTCGDEETPQDIEIVFIDEHRRISMLTLNDIRPPNPKKDIQLQERASRDRKAFTDFLRKKRPEVAVVAGYSSHTKSLLTQVNALIEDYNRRYREDTEDEIDVLVVNDEVARLCKRDSQADKPWNIKFREEKDKLKRYCASIARLVQTPLHEYTALGDDTTLLDLHPMQRLVHREKLKEALERVIIDVTNSVGVNLSLALDDPYLANVVKYVSGLGPRKAKGVLDSLGRLRRELGMDSQLSREFLKNEKILKPKIFENCASFIRIDGTAEPLDTTRIHPQDYPIARKMVCDALDADVEDVMECEPAATYVRRIMEREPDKLNDLSLDEYAEEIANIYRSVRSYGLYLIKQELQEPYKDMRAEFKKPSPDEIFEYIYRENDKTLYPGCFVPDVQIVRVQEKIVNCKLASGLDAIINVYRITDQPLSDARLVLQEGQTVDCKVVRVDKYELVVELTCKPNEVIDIEEDNSIVPDPYYDKAAETLATRTQKVARRPPQKTPQKRILHHSLFKDMTWNEAEKHLEDKRRGETVLRPSSKGPNVIGCTWKVAPNIYQHLDVMELPKGPDGKAKVKVGEYEYSEIDELLVHHIDSSARKLGSLLNHSKFRTDKAALENYLLKQLQWSPQFAAYGFCLDPVKAGGFLIGIRNSLRTETVYWHGVVVPEGFRLNQMNYATVNDLITGFKKLAGHSLAFKANRN